jgi:hypothetical protein
MTAFFGKSTLTDPLGISTSRVLDPLKINSKIQNQVDRTIDPSGKRFSKATSWDMFGLSDFSARNTDMLDAKKKQTLLDEQNKPVVSRANTSTPSVAANSLLGGSSTLNR